MSTIDPATSGAWPFRLDDHERRLKILEDQNPAVMAEQIKTLRAEIRGVKLLLQTVIVLLIGFLGALVPLLTR